MDICNIHICKSKVGMYASLFRTSGGFLWSSINKYICRHIKDIRQGTEGDPPPATHGNLGDSGMMNQRRNMAVMGRKAHRCINLNKENASNVSIFLIRKILNWQVWSHVFMHSYYYFVLYFILFANMDESHLSCTPEWARRWKSWGPPQGQMGNLASLKLEKVQFLQCNVANCKRNDFEMHA